MFVCMYVCMYKQHKPSAYDMAIVCLLFIFVAYYFHLLWCLGFNGCVVSFIFTQWHRICVSVKPIPIHIDIKQKRPQVNQSVGCKDISMGKASATHTQICLLFWFYGRLHLLAALAHSYYLMAFGKVEHLVGGRLRLERLQKASGLSKFCTS